MKRTLLNLIVETAAAVLLQGMIATGYILRFPLPPGTNKSHVLWGLTRHCWGSVHFWICAALLAVLLLHVVQHWQWLVSVVAKRLGRAAPSAKRVVQVGLIAAVVLTVISLLFVWITDRGVQRITDASLFRVCPTTDEQKDPSLSSNEDSVKSANGKAGTLNVTFAKDVSPILARSCLSGHGPNRAAGNFRVDRQQDFYQKSGQVGRDSPAAGKPFAASVLRPVRTKLRVAARRIGCYPSCVMILRETKLARHFAARPTGIGIQSRTMADATSRSAAVASVPSRITPP